MHSLDDIDIIIPCRISDPERRENLLTVISFLLKTYTSFRIIVVESDHFSVFNSFRSLFPNDNIIHIFERDTKPFSRSRCLNLGARLAISPILCFHDCDVIADIEAMKHSVHILRDTDISDVRTPHGAMINIFGELKRRFCETLDISLLKDITVDNLADESYILYENVPSAVVFYKKKQFIEIGGFNETFTGWGGEDSELLLRGMSFGLKHHMVHVPLIHLNHGPTDPDMAKHLRAVEGTASGADSKFAAIQDYTPEQFAALAETLRKNQFGL